MFDQLKNMKEMMSLLGNAGELKQKAEQIQAELARKTVQADAGAGAVRVTVSGKLQVVRVELDRPLITALAGEGQDADVQMIEDLVAAATNEALSRAQAMVQEEMSKLAGGLNLPGLENLMG